MFVRGFERYVYEILALEGVVGREFHRRRLFDMMILFL